MLEHTPSPAEFSNRIRKATGSCYAFRLAVVHRNDIYKVYNKGYVFYIFMEQLTFNTKIGYDDIQSQFEYQAKKQRETIKLMCNGKYGIVSEVATSINSSSLYARMIDSNILSFTSGTIVTKSGNIAYIDEFSINIPAINKDTIVLYVYTKKGSKEKRLSNSGKAHSVTFYLENPTKCVQFMSKEAYDNLSIDVLENSVCLAILSYVSGNILVDCTQSIYSFNRPWFSLYDTEHRSMKGSGSESVPHSIGLNDLTSNQLTIYDQLLTRGLIISKDLSIAGIPGTLYKNEEDFKVSIESLDDGETLTKVVNLQNCYPNAIASVTTVSGEDVACHLVKGSNYLIIDDDTPEGTILNIQMAVTNTLIPKITGNQVNEITFKNKDPNDTIITQGLQVDLNSTEVSFSDCSNFNKNFEIVVNSDGTLHKEPEIISPLQSISKYETYYISREFDIPVRIQLLRNSSSSGIVVLDIYGKDIDGKDIIETIEINLEGELESFETINYFRYVSHISNHYTKENPDYEYYKLPSTVSLVIFAYSNRALDRRTRILNLSWDGENQTFNNVKDIRPISTIIRDSFKTSVVKEASKNIINSLNVKSFGSTGKLKYFSVLIEDFYSPEYLDSNSVTWITSGKGISFPIIPRYIADTSSYTLCYRSRKLNIFRNTTEHSIEVTLYAYLVQPDLETLNSYPIRLVKENSEIVFDNNMNNGLFSTKLIVNPDSVIYGKILVTGTTSGVSIFYSLGE